MRLGTHGCDCIVWILRITATVVPSHDGRTVGTVSSWRNSDNAFRGGKGILCHMRIIRNVGGDRRRRDRHGRNRGGPRGENSDGTRSGPRGKHSDWTRSRPRGRNSDWQRSWSTGRNTWCVVSVAIYLVAGLEFFDASYQGAAKIAAGHPGSCRDVTVVGVSVVNFRHAKVIHSRLTIAIRDELCLEVNQRLCTLARARCLAICWYIRRRIGKENHVKLAQSAIG